MNISSIAASGPFSQTNNCGSTLSAGASCAISIIFTPGAYGSFNGAVTVTDSAGKTYTTSLSGTGADFAGPAWRRFQ